MPIEKLSAKFVRDCRKVGLHGDGRGLALRVTTADQRSWVYRYTLRGRAHEIGLGSVLEVSLADARKKAVELRALKGAGVDPLAHKRQQKADARELVTFKSAAEEYIKAHRASWRSPKHLHQWQASLATYAFPTLGDLSVDTIDTPHILKALRPFWDSKITTAIRVRGRIESVLAWCAVQHYRSGDNPARWKGHLDHLLANPAELKRQRKTNHAAIHYDDLPAVMATLRSHDDLACRALEFTVLTVARTAESAYARWDEIDFNTATWTVPGNRMKGGIEHRVPLCARALAIVNTLPRKGARIFDISDDVMLRRVKKLVPGAATVHGFRATFRTWAEECTTTPPAVVEKCLAHLVGNAVERAYQRSDLLDKRRELLNRWAAHSAPRRSHLRDEHDPALDK